MLDYTELKKGVVFILEGQPYEVLESSSVFKGRGSTIVQTKLKNLINGNTISKTFHPGDSFQEAEINKIKATFLYSHRDKFVFCRENNPADRFELTKEIIGPAYIFLKPKESVQAIEFEDKIINIVLPIKVHLKVREAPPGIKGDRSQAGNKIATLETGAQIAVPLFVQEGDIIEVNTERGEYVRRIQ